MGTNENARENGNTSRGTEDRKVIEELLTETSQVVSPDAELYYFQIQFTDDTQRIAHRKKILSELDNALDIWTARPEIEEIGSSDLGIGLLIETRIDPKTIVEALDNDCLDTVDYWTIDPDAFELDVATTPKSENEAVTAEFDQLRQQYADGSGGNAGNLGSESFEFTEPQSVRFSEDEIEFEELLGETNDKNGVTSEAPAQHHRPESLVGALVAELEDGVAADDNAAMLRELLAQKQSSNSIAVRLEHVQSRMDTFTAYLDSLEEFLDEEGTAQQLLEELRADIDGLRDELQTAADEREELRRRVAELETNTPSTDEVETEFAQVKRNVETASTTLQQEIDDLDARVKTMQADLDEQTAWRQQLRAAVTTTDSDGEVPSEQ
jgi:DNA repair exonuclease SbcCD ATPase subunit